MVALEYIIYLIRIRMSLLIRVEPCTADTTTASLIYSHLIFFIYVWNFLNIYCVTYEHSYLFIFHISWVYLNNLFSSIVVCILICANSLFYLFFITLFNILDLKKI